MAITSPGPVRFSQIQSEFGGANPIQFKEYYRGGSYVKEEQDNSFTATARNTSRDSQFGSRGGYDIGPSFNASGRLYTQSRWSDGGSQYSTVTMTLDAGVYTVYVGAFLQRSGQYYEFAISVNGTQVHGGRKSYSSYGTNASEFKVTVPQDGVLRVYNFQSALFNTWQSNIIYIGGDSKDTRRVTDIEAINRTIPTGSTIKASDFFGARRYEEREVNVSAYDAVHFDRYDGFPGPVDSIFGPAYLFINTSYNYAGSEYFQTPSIRGNNAGEPTEVVVWRRKRMVAEFTNDYDSTTVNVPELSVQLRGDVDDGWSAVGFPGIQLNWVNPTTGAEVEVKRVSNFSRTTFSEGEAWKSGTIPALNATYAKGGTFRLYYTLYGYDDEATYNPSTDSFTGQWADNWNRWISPALKFVYKTS